MGSRELQLLMRRMRSDHSLASQPVQSEDQKLLRLRVGLGKVEVLVDGQRRTR